MHHTVGKRGQLMTVPSETVTKDTIKCVKLQKKNGKKFVCFEAP